jgi:hypothetical protein
MLFYPKASGPACRSPPPGGLLRTPTSTLPYQSRPWLPPTESPAPCLLRVSLTLIHFETSTRQALIDSDSGIRSSAPRSSAWSHCFQTELRRVSSPSIQGPISFSILRPETQLAKGLSRFGANAIFQCMSPILPSTLWERKTKRRKGPLQPQFTLIQLDAFYKSQPRKKVRCDISTVQNISESSQCPLFPNLESAPYPLLRKNKLFLKYS